MKKVREDSAVISACPECGSSKLARDMYRAELACAECGFVIREHILDPGPEWRAFTEEQMKERTRTGPPASPLFHDYGHMTVVGTDNKGLTASQRARASKLRRQQRWSMIKSGKERGLVSALEDIRTIGSQLSLPQIVKESAADIYRKIADRNGIRGKTIENMVAAAVLVACKRHKIPRTINEIIAASGSRNKKDITKCYRSILRSLSIQSEIISPSDFVFRIATELGVSNATREKALEVLKLIKSKRVARLKGELRGVSPQAIASAVIYVASILTGDYITQREAAGVLNVSEVTVRNTYKRIMEKIGKRVG